jgi:hypothetical protein
LPIAAPSIADRPRSFLFFLYPNTPALQPSNHLPYIKDQNQISPDHTQSHIPCQCRFQPWMPRLPVAFAGPNGKGLKALNLQHVPTEEHDGD